MLHVPPLRVICWGHIFITLLWALFAAAAGFLLLLVVYRLLQGQLCRPGGRARRIFSGHKKYCYGGLILFNSFNWVAVVMAFWLTRLKDCGPPQLSQLWQELWCFNVVSNSQM